MDEEALRKLSDEISAEFYMRVDKKYDLNERCIIAKLYDSDFQTLSNIIFNRLTEKIYKE